MKKISEIQNLFDEIAYYESRGQYKLADSIVKQLQKIAKQVQVKDLTGNELATAFTDSAKFLQLNTFIRNIPECALAFSINKDFEPFFMGDYKDCIGSFVNAGQKLEDAYVNCNKMVGKNPELQVNQDKIDACMKKIFQRFITEPTTALTPVTYEREPAPPIT